MKKERKKVSFSIIEYKNMCGSLVLVNQTLSKVEYKKILGIFTLQSNTVIKQKTITVWKPQKGIINHPKYKDGDWLFIKCNDSDLTHYEGALDITNHLDKLYLLNNVYLIDILNKSKKIN